MDDFTQSSDDLTARDELTGTLLESVDEIHGEPIEDEDVTRALDRARRLDCSTTPRRSRGIGRVLAVAAAAAVLLGVALTWWDVPPVAWAEVAQAMKNKTWLHAVSKLPDGTKYELWFSTSRGVLAGRVGESLIWADYRQRTREEYDPENNWINRFPDTQSQAADEFFEAIYGAFLSADAGQTVAVGKRKLVHQQQRVVFEGGRRCIEHRFRLQGPQKQQVIERRTEWVVYVDPATQLPFRWEQVYRTLGEGLDPTKASVRRFDVDYPETGPADIYALGAPKTAEVIDRVLEAAQPDIERLLAGVKAARSRADKRNVLVVQSRDDEHWSQGSSVCRIWRSGSRWRVDRSRGPVTRPSDELAPEDADPAAWWRNKAEKLPFRPEELCDGKWLWEYVTKSRRPTQADIDAGAPKDTHVLVSIDKKRRHLASKGLGADSYSSRGWPRVVYYVHWNLKATLDPTPTSGPPDTVLLELRNLAWKPEHGKRSPQIERFWIDPERDYLVIRSERLVTRKEKEQIIGGSVIEGVTQSPQGQWYPTVIRHLQGTRHMGSDKTQDYILRFYYDFDSPIPDSLFEP